MKVFFCLFYVHHEMCLSFSYLLTCFCPLHAMYLVGNVESVEDGSYDICLIAVRVSVAIGEGIGCERPVGDNDERMFLRVSYAERLTG